MKSNETPEILLDWVYHSTKIRKLAIMLVITGIIVCFILLLPPIKKNIFSIAIALRPGISGGLDKISALLSSIFIGLEVFYCCFAFCSQKIFPPFWKMSKIRD